MGSRNAEMTSRGCVTQRLQRLGRLEKSRRFSSCFCQSSKSLQSLRDTPPAAFLIKKAGVSMPAIDFDVLRSQVRLEDVMKITGYMSGYDLRVTVRGPCPMKCHEDHRACSINHSRQKWYCHRCKAGGGSLELFAQMKGLPLFAACIELCKMLGVVPPFLPTVRQAFIPGTQQDGDHLDNRF